jgi:lycopene cyclase domain-containing protein
VTYWALNAFFLAAVALVAVAAVLRSRTPRWQALALAAVVLLATTAVFDNIMIGIGLVDYDPGRISGAFVGIAPLEDFAYAVAAAVLLPSLWHLLGPRERGAGSARSSTRSRRAGDPRA